MEAMYISSFLYGLTSSLHCIFMCGPFVGALNLNTTNKYLINTLYNMGRGWSYFIIGFFLGYAGEKTNTLGNMLQIQTISAIISGIFVIVIGTLIVFNKRFSNFSGGFIASKLIQPLMKFIKSSKNYSLVSFTVGLLSGLLPCGVLYPAFAISFASGNSLEGGLSMLSFFAGTFPGLFIFGLGFHKIRQQLNPTVLSAMGMLIILVGIFTIFMRFHHDHSHHNHPSTNSHQSEPKENNNSHDQHKEHHHHHE